jgi:hypothetical protein
VHIATHTAATEAARPGWLANRRRLKSWGIIAAFALLTLFFGSCPDGAMAGNTSAAGGVTDWLYQCSITRPLMPAG